MVSDEQPLVMGHEASGIVHSIGPAVTKVIPGDRFAIELVSLVDDVNNVKQGDMIFFQR